MISYLKGTVAYMDEDGIVIDNHSIGYQIKTPGRTAESVRPGQELTLFTYLYVREDALALYGFLTREELRTFQILLGISGIGPKAALSVLSTLSVEDLYYAVLSDDVKSISRTPGIGPKGAKRMIMELKDKLSLENIGVQAEESSESSTEDPAGNGPFTDTIEALTALGYSNGEAYRAVHKVPGGQTMDAEHLLKEALKMILTLV